MSDPVTEQPKIDQVVQKYIQLRDRKDVLKDEFKKKTEDIDNLLSRCEAFILQHLNAMGGESIKTAAGTAYIKVRTTASVTDWDETLNFIKENNLWSMLEQRVSKSVVEAYRTEHNDIPPGVKWGEERVVNIRRS